jgi:hypothetical protein
MLTAAAGGGRPTRSSSPVFWALSSAFVTAAASESGMLLAHLLFD